MRNAGAPPPREAGASIPCPRRAHHFRLFFLSFALGNRCSQSLSGCFKFLQQGSTEGQFKKYSTKTLAVFSSGRPMHICRICILTWRSVGASRGLWNPGPASLVRPRFSEDGTAGKPWGRPGAGRGYWVGFYFLVPTASPASSKWILGTWANSEIRVVIAAPAFQARKQNQNNYRTPI